MDRASLVAICCLLTLVYQAVDGSVAPPIDNRLLTARTVSGSTVVLFSCTADRYPTTNPNAPVNNLCYVQCFDTACNLYNIGTLKPPALVNAQMLAFGISPLSGEIALMYTSDIGLYLWLCDDLDCSTQHTKTLRIWNSTNGGTTLGNSLALTRNGTWTAAFTEPLASPTPSYQTVLVTCSKNYCENRTESLVSSWNSIGTPQLSPNFIRTDLNDRYIVGMQTFRDNTTYFLELWRCEATLDCTIMSNTTLEKPITSISVSPASTTSANSGVVLITGIQLNMFSYASGLNSGTTPDPAQPPRSPSVGPPPTLILQKLPLVPTDNSTANSTTPSDNPSDSPAEPNTDAPSVPALDTPPNDTQPAPITDSPPVSPTPTALEPPTVIVPEIRPVAESPVIPPIAPPTSLNSSYWYSSSLHRIGQAAGATVGFQMSLTSIGTTPIFSFSYVQGGVYCRVSRGFCGTPNCRSQILTVLAQSTEVDTNPALPHTAVAILAGGNVAIFTHNPTGDLLRTVYSSFSASTPITDGSIDTAAVVPQPSPKGNWDVLGIVGIANAAIASVIVLISLVVFLIHFSISRRNDDDLVFWDAQRLTRQQLGTLTAYYRELKED